MLCLLQAVGKVSLAAKGLCLWVRAMETYGSVAKDVAPKRLKLKTAQDNLSKKQTALAAAQTQLAEVLAKVQALKVSMISRSCLLHQCSILYLPDDALYPGCNPLLVLLGWLRKGVSERCSWLQKGNTCHSSRSVAWPFCDASRLAD